MTIMARIVTLLFLLGATSILGACETSKGVVRDLSNAGNALIGN